MDGTTLRKQSSFMEKMKTMRADTVQNLAVLAIFLLLCLVVTIIEPTFLSITNFSNILVQVSSVVIIASAVTMVLISGNLDLSVGAVGAMAGVLFAIFARAGIPVGFSIALALGAGALFGAINGYLVARLSLPSFIITMAMMYITRGIAFIGAGGAVISMGLPGNFGVIAKGMIGPFSMPVIYMLFIFGLFIFLQNKTVWAKQNYAIGANIETAKLSGIKVVKTLMITFALSGLMAAFAGVLVTSRFAQADCKILMGMEFDAVVAAVLGGTDINGGKGTVFGMIIGALIVGVLSNVLNMLGFAIYAQNVVKGCVLVAAIIMNRVIREKIKA